MNINENINVMNMNEVAQFYNSPSNYTASMKARMEPKIYQRKCQDEKYASVVN